MTQLRTQGDDNIWQNRTYQRATCKLLAIIRETMFRFGDKNSYSTQMDAILLALLAGDYNYAMQINTGEGKALISTCIAVALQAMTDKQIVITTSNLSLASRDAEVFDKFIQWFDISHASISATSKKKDQLNANIIHTTGADFALFHGKKTLIDNSNRIYLNDEYDYTMSHLMPAINSQSKADSLESWWVYEEILNYVTDMTQQEAKKESDQQTTGLIEQLSNKFNQELTHLQQRKARLVHEIETDPNLSPDEKIHTQQKAVKPLLESINTLIQKIKLLNKETTFDEFNTLIDSAILAQYVFNRGTHYEIIDYVEDGRKLKKVVPVESGKPIVEGDVMYMYGIHQFLIQKCIVEDGQQHEFLQPSALESTTYFNNYSIQVGGKSIGVSGTIPKQQYAMYQALLDEGRSTILPPHHTSLRKDAIPFEKFNEVKSGSDHVLNNEQELITTLAQTIINHDGPALIYCKDKNQCEARQALLISQLKSQGYHIQLIINGVTEDFTSGDKLTASGRQAQKVKTVTLTVGDGRGIDINPEGKDGLLTMCSFVPETAEKVLQIYGRSGRNGKPGKTNLFILDNELTNYGQNFNNLAEQFTFLDKVRTKEFEFAIKKIGFIQYEIQQKIGRRRSSNYNN